jgi:hypothetical protein
LAEETANTENTTADRVAELGRLLAQKDEELGKSTARIAELEEKQHTVSQALTGAIAGYKKLMVQMNPGVMADLIQGETIETIDASLEKARSIVGQVKQSIEKEQALARVPMGSPARRKPDIGELSPREKIQYAIGGKK